MAAALEFEILPKNQNKTKEKTEKEEVAQQRVCQREILP